MVRGMNSKVALALAVTAFLANLPLRAAEIPPANEQKSDGSIMLLATNATVHGTNIRYEPQPHKNTIGFWTRLRIG